MMLNKPVEIGGANNVTMPMSVDELRVRLHRRLKRIAKARAQLDLHEAEALREAQKVQLWKEFGHTSLVDYMVNELGYTSHHTAEERLRLANALPQLPKLTEAIQTGQINMSQARELSRVVTPETEEKWIATARDLNVRQVERAVTGHVKGDLPEDPIDPRLVRKTLYLSVRPETEILFREARKALEAERGEKLDEDAVVEAMCRLVLRSAVRSRARAVHDDGGDGCGDSSHVGVGHRDDSGVVAGHRNDSSGVGAGGGAYRDPSDSAGAGGGAYRDPSDSAGMGAGDRRDSSHVGAGHRDASSHVGAGHREDSFGEGAGYRDDSFGEGAGGAAGGGAYRDSDDSSGVVPGHRDDSFGEGAGSGAYRDPSDSSGVGAGGAAGGDAYRNSDDSSGVGAGHRDDSSGVDRDDSSHVGASGPAYRVAVTVCEHCRRGWQHGAGAVVELSPAAVERATCDAQWIGNLESELVERARQDISPATRRKVLHRDQNRCRAPGCQCHTNLDVHHIRHREDGGGNELSNLVTLCEAHHLAHHAGTLNVTRDTSGNVTFTRQASNRYTRTTREVATREELRRRGYDRLQIASIMASTINTIGETDLTEQQWLMMALRAANEHSS